jgi:hypothetical protein
LPLDLERIFLAPQWAALTAVVSQTLKKKAGFFIPLLYANSKAATNDIAIGNNSVFGVTGFSAKRDGMPAPARSEAVGASVQPWRSCYRRTPCKYYCNAAGPWNVRSSQPTVQRRPTL